MTQFTYSPAGDLTKLTDGRAKNTYWGYDAYGIGTSSFTYTDWGGLASEDGPWAADLVSYQYTAPRRTRLTVDQPNAAPWVQTYAYDTAARLDSTTSPAGLFDYTPHSLRKWLFQSISLPGGAVIERQYETNAWLSLTRLKQSGGTVLNSHAYTYDQNGRPTRQTRQGGDYVDYTYDPTGQLLSALGKESGGSINRLNERYGYAYDAGGNLLRRTNSVSAPTPLVQTFTVNDRNELTTATRSGTLTVAGTSSSAATSVTVSANGGSAVGATRYADATFARQGVSLNNGNNTFTATGTDAQGRQSTHAITVNLPSTVTFSYDDNGNLTGDGRRSFTYDDENQLISVSVASAWKAEFGYDGLSRRRVRKEYAWVSSAWQQTNEVRYVYDGPLVVQERDRLNVPQVTYTRGPDLSGRLFGAGGIGGLLARTEAAGSAYYHADLGGNVTALVNGNQAIVARYLYDAYGNLLSQSGPLAEANLYRFSSTEAHPAAGLSYYLYRYYDPNLQRWLNRDPIGERGGINLAEFARNSPMLYIDTDGRLVQALPFMGPAGWIALGALGVYALCPPCQEAVKNAGAAVLDAVNQAIDDYSDDPPEQKNKGKEEPGRPKPIDCPTGTKPLDQHPDKDRVHPYKDRVHPYKEEWGAKRNDWVGIAPDGTVGMGNDEGLWSEIGHVDETHPPKPH